MKGPRRSFAKAVGLAASAVLVVTTAMVSSGAAQSNAELTYSIPYAKAYATKVSVSKEVIEAASSRCHRHRDGETHPIKDENEAKAHTDTPTSINYPYYCDKNAYEQVNNCPDWRVIGPAKEIAVPAPLEVGNANVLSGGSDVTHNIDPPLASPIQLHDYESFARLTSLLGTQESGGFASRRYVDNDGRAVPTAHTESDGFSPNRSSYEERCYPVENEYSTEENPPGKDNPRSKFTGTDTPPNWTQVYSKSGQEPSTTHKAECVGASSQLQTSAKPAASGECRLALESGSRDGSGIGLPATARHGLTITKLWEKDGKLNGELLAVVEGLSFSAGAFTADSITSYLKFSTDGTKAGLHWKVVSEAQGEQVCGNPTQLQKGSTSAASCEGATFSVGMTAPYVKASKDGKELTVAVPGLVIAWNTQVPVACFPEPFPTSVPVPQCSFVRPQTAYVAGVELRSSQDRAEPFALTTFNPPAFAPIDTFSALGTSSYSIPLAPLGAQPDLNSEPSERTVAIRSLGASKATGYIILGLGILAILLILFSWVRRFGWGATLFKYQPFKFFLWFHRAFVRT